MNKTNTVAAPRAFSLEIKIVMSWHSEISNWWYSWARFEFEGVFYLAYTVVSLPLFFSLSPQINCQYLKMRFHIQMDIEDLAA